MTVERALVIFVLVVLVLVVLAFLFGELDAKGAAAVLGWEV